MQSSSAADDTSRAPAEGNPDAAAGGEGGGDGSGSAAGSGPQPPLPVLNRPYIISQRSATNETQLLRPVPSSAGGPPFPSVVARGAPMAPSYESADVTEAATSQLRRMSTGEHSHAGSAPPRASNANPRAVAAPSKDPSPVLPLPANCLNPATEINSRLDTQVEVRVYPCNNNADSSNHPPKKKFTQFHVKPEGVIIQGTNRHRAAHLDLGSEYAAHIGRKLQRYELSDTRACQLLVTTHGRSFWVVPAPEAFSRHSGTCRLLGDRKHPPAAHSLQVGDFLRVGSVGVVVIETHDGRENRVLSEEKIRKIMKDTTNGNGGGAFLDCAETDGENSDDSVEGGGGAGGGVGAGGSSTSPAAGIAGSIQSDVPTCYMCFDEEDTPENPMITPCKCLGDTRYVHVECLRKWHTAEADNQVCFLSSVDATCSVCKTTFRSDFKLKDGRLVKLFKSSLEPPYVSLLVATKHEMAQRLFNTRFQLSFSTLLKSDGRNGTRPLLLGRSSGSDMILDYRTVSAQHATIRFKNGEFLFTDAGSSNGSYLYLRRPVELSPSQSVQFRLGRSMISMKVVNKWNRRLLRAVSRRAGLASSSGSGAAGGGDDDRSVGSNEDDVRVTNANGEVTRTLPRRTREHIMESMPPLGKLNQNSSQHLDLLYALAYPSKAVTGEKKV
mmetsp:Transcript_39495/g.84282  ORF Transcript_39495/g.84282 Transcript_39495/m.84282 type:complete len:667 (+) Transcript_39495:20-2020(+)